MRRWMTWRAGWQQVWLSLALTRAQKGQISAVLLSTTSRHAHLSRLHG